MLGKLAIGRHLATYDPNWQERHEAATAALDAHLAKRSVTAESLQESGRLLRAQQDAFHAQFPTADAYRDWLFGTLKRESRISAALC